MSRVSPEYVILGLLESQSCHGYQLLPHFRSPDRLGRIWKLGTSRIYTLLKQLERQELIDGREEDAEDAPMRTVYWLTDSGRERLFQWLEQEQPDASTRNIRTEFLSRLYIARVLDRPTQPIIDAQREACTQRIAQLEAHLQHQEDSLGDLALSLQIAEMRLILDWLATCEAVVSRVQNPSTEQLNALISEDCNP